MDHADHVRLIEAGVRPAYADDGRAEADGGRAEASRGPAEASRGPSATGELAKPAWADLGSGWGAFTLALADVLGPGATIHSVDRDGAALRQQAREMASRFPGISLEQTVADFTAPLELPPLDGVVMANSLHFVRNKLPVLALVRGYLRPGGRLVLVEYDSDEGNRWVPYPMTFTTWRTVAEEAGFVETARLASVPSRFLGSIYSAVSINP